MFNNPYAPIITSSTRGGVRDEMNSKISRHNENDIMGYRMNRHQNADSHSEHVDRMLNERGGMFKNMNQQNTSNKYDHYNDPRLPMGEITGKMFELDELEQGMPIRSFSNDSKRDEYDPEDPYFSQGCIPNIDFDLYDHQPNLDISYHDPYGNNVVTHFSDISEVDSKILSKKKYDFSKIINEFTFYLMNEFLNVYKRKSSMVLSPFLVLQQLATLYIGSSGSTERELGKAIFSADKTSIFEYFNDLNTELFDFKNMMHRSLILISKSNVLNTTFTNHILSISTVYPFNMTRINNDIKKINDNLNTKILEKGMINKDTSILLLSLFQFHCKWKYSFDSKLLKRHFYGLKGKRVVPMMIQRNKEYLYYSDNKNKIVEIDLYDPKYAVGFVVSTSKDTILAENQLEHYISRLTPVHLNVILIPKFKQESKFKLDNIFKKLGLENIFSNADLPNITSTPNILKVSNIIHQVCIDVGERGVINNSSSTETKSSNNINFEANRPFIFYVRLKSSIESPVILLFGKYC